MKYKIIRLILCIVLISITGCKSRTTYIPVESISTEYINTMQRDSVYMYDSIFVKEKNDTVYFTKYKYLYQHKVNTDTVIKTDSIRVPYPVIETVEINRLKWYQQACIWFTGIVLFAVLIFLFLKSRKFLR